MSDAWIQFGIAAFGWWVLLLLLADISRSLRIIAKKWQAPIAIGRGLSVESKVERTFVAALPSTGAVRAEVGEQE